MIGECSCSDSIRCMPKGVALMLLPSRYPRLKSVSIMFDLVLFVPKFFFSRSVMREEGVNREGGRVSFSIVSIFVMVTGPVMSGRELSSREAGYTFIHPFSRRVVAFAVKVRPFSDVRTMCLEAVLASGEKAAMN